MEEAGDVVLTGPRRGLAAVILGVALLTVACGGPPPAGPKHDSPVVAEIAAKEFAFEPSEIKVPRGRIVIKLTNVGAMEHDLQFRDLEEAWVHVNPGESKTLELNLEPGTYEFYCTIPGHEALGMVGRLIVE